MIGTLLVAVGFALAIGSQLRLVGHMRRQWPSVPSRIPYGTLPGRYFAWGPRELMWITPATMIALTAAVGLVIAAAPPFVRSQPLLAIPFLVLALTTPLLRWAIDAKIDAARRNQP